VVEGGDGLRLALEPLPSFRRRHLSRKDLESDLAVELRVLGEIDLAHPALSELLEDAVVRERRADHRFRSMTQRSATSSSQWK
jgi:hypothetical protein